ncbi:RidA family protein [Actinocatenispora rupis]|uniref:Enamine deaminase RidA, house cleaning of reactive enamine intermediates, YjgF/YER057c/UK114 family n=1 Tax=Actinocatenispora rupis TaxID=519421 RepID=A0A8J3NFV8_9ACTN|nr:RidA family protein [Actinocatenispora rupis]GID14219.1 hypothetical protein Aru02nite_51080 [Actinocatenispora rupis]
MNVTLDNPVGVAAPAGPYSHVARLDLGAGALLVLSGQIAADDTGAVVAPGDMAAQSEYVLEMIGGILAAHGATFADVLHVRTFVTDLADLPAYGAVRAKYLPQRPASTTVQVSRLFKPGAVLEVEVLAAAGTDRG